MVTKSKTVVEDLRQYRQFEVRTTLAKRAQTGN